MGEINSSLNSNSNAISKKVSPSQANNNQKITMQCSRNYYIFTYTILFSNPMPLDHLLDVRYLIEYGVSQEYQFHEGLL